MADAEGLAAEKICFAVCPAVVLIITAMVIALIIHLRTRRMPEFSSFVDAFSFYTISILYIGFRSTIITGLVAMLIGISVLVFGFLLYGPILMVIGFSMFLPGIGLLASGFIRRRTVPGRIMMLPPWTSAISKRKLKITPDSIGRLFSYLQNLKILVAWLTLTGTLVVIWGLMDLPVLILFGDNFSGSDNFFLLLFMPVVKITTGTLLLLAVKFVMVNPLKKPGFWENAISER